MGRLRDRPRRFRVRGGRTVAFDVYGDPRGVPVIYCHGFPTSRLEALLAAPVARRAGARLVVADRPGFGRSDPQPGRRMEDWVEDATALMDRLALERCPVIGVSGGGPYAAMLAARAPERVDRLALVCPLAPLDVPDALRGMLPLSAWGLRLTRRYPATSERVFRYLLAPVPRRFPGVFLRLLSGSVHPPSDARLLRRPRVFTRIRAAIGEGLHQGGAGAARELRLFATMRSGSFPRPEAPADVWHGSADRVTPVAMARWYADRLPNARFHPVEGGGHFSLPIEHARVIVDTLLAR